LSYAELASTLRADQRTIARYIEIFEQSFVLFRLYPYTRRARDEIGKAAKVYFYDTGLRNAVIGDFRGMSERNDKGALFENFIVSELVKQNTYTDAGYALHYWRTKQGSEMDVVLSKPGRLIGVEVKYGRARANRAFKNRYPEATVRMVTTTNFL
jgi:predicted AAA+ superfamily ATPase